MGQDGLDGGSRHGAITNPGALLCAERHANRSNSTSSWTRPIPNSKFILTVRDEADWLESVRRHFDPRTNQFVESWKDNPFTNRIHTQIYGRKKFQAAAFLSAYRKHNAGVIGYFKGRSRDLLVMNMSRKTAWAELASFLDVAPPAGDYPVVGLTGSLRPVSGDCSHGFVTPWKSAVIAMSSWLPEWFHRT